MIFFIILKIIGQCSFQGSESCYPGRYPGPYLVAGNEGTDQGSDRYRYPDRYPGFLQVATATLDFFHIYFGPDYINFGPDYINFGLNHIKFGPDHINLGQIRI